MVARTRDQLLEAFEQQIGFLERSNAWFDQGHIDEAIRMATPLRVLFHDTAQSHALLDQLAFPEPLTWIDTAGMPDPNNLLSVWGLVQTGIDIGERRPTFRAPLGDRPPSQIITKTMRLPRGSRILREFWWEEPVIRDSEGTEFSRQELVLTVANKEGGAHVDPKIKNTYDKLANSNSMGWTYRDGDRDEVPLSSPVPYALRQISYEVVESVNQQRDRIR
ncbi:hypothetical protein [Tsukamurella pseudospumae]|uniref:Uncharacterized protein n=1 Tax=Tsukamurella pseudospumae TaxID=239498 RepID=A0A138AW96_9ACTN|nr:hypothetical protein [Tsukamurella pseudospumae]KXP14692.1 hypothetical protein AXK60_02040 [Tsukamurella pseudospumae]